MRDNKTVVLDIPWTLHFSLCNRYTNCNNMKCSPSTERNGSFLNIFLYNNLMFETFKIAHNFFLIMTSVTFASLIFMIHRRNNDRSHQPNEWIIPLLQISLNLRTCYWITQATGPTLIHSWRKPSEQSKIISTSSEDLRYWRQRKKNSLIECHWKRNNSRYSTYNVTTKNQIR